MNDIPVYYSKFSAEKNYDSFLDFVENYLMITETEDPKVAEEYLKKSISTLHFVDVFKNLEKYATDKLLALVLLAQEEDISKEEILNLLIEAASLETTSGFGGENFAFAIPIKKELECNLHKFKGKLDGKNYPDIYEELKKPLKPETIKKINDKKHDIEEDILKYKIPQYYWAAYIDEEKFKDLLVNTLKISEKEIEQLTKVG